jgi:drug/metabolite transporter (DMT)-like permease
MNEVFAYGLLLAALIFVVNGLRWRQGGGSTLVVAGVAFALIGASRLIGPKFMPVMLVAFVVGVIGLAVSFYSRRPEGRAGMRAVFGLAFAVFAVIGAMVILGYAGIHGTPLVILMGILGVLGAAFIVVAMTRLAMDVRADRHV